MDRLKLYQTFVAVVEKKSFSGAAKRMGISTPTVTRAIQFLESQLGIKLINRNTRVLRLTEPGMRFYADIKRILSELDEAEIAVNSEHAALRGEVSVTAPTMFGRLHVAPVVAQFLTHHNQITARTLFVDRMVDLIDEGIDVAIRIAQLPDSSMRAVRVGSVRRVVCASPAYLAEHGIPASLEELDTLRAIDLSVAPVQQQWSFSAGGRPKVVRPPPRLTVNSVDTAIEAAVAGLGVARLLSYQIAPQLKQKQLKVILADFEPPATPIHVVYLDRALTSTRVRTFVDFVVASLRQQEAF